MKILSKYILTGFAVFAVAASGHAQQETTLHFMKSVPQHVNNNPAFTPNWNFTFSLPVISSSFISYNNSLAYKDIITRRPEDDSLMVDINKMGSALRRRNLMSANLQTDLFGFGFRAGKLYFTVNASLKTFNEFSYPRSFMALFAEGNAQYIGKTVEISPAFNSISYGEISLGTAYQVNSNLTVGARYKYLAGIVNVHTKESTYNLSVDNINHGMTLTGNASIQTSGIKEFLDEDYESSFSPSDFLQNRGHAFDFGATYKLDEKLTLGLSILDLGSIQWKNEAQTLTLGEGQSLSFSGVDFMNEEDEESFGLLDSLINTFEIKDIASYRSRLPARFYLSADYKLFRNTYVGGLIYGQSVNGRFRYAFSTSVLQNLHKNFSASVSYTTTGFSNHLGGGLVFRLASMQFHLISDNIITSALSPLNARSLNARVGMTFTVGSPKE